METFNYTPKLLDPNAVSTHDCWTHYIVDELCSTTIASNSIRSIEIPTSGTFILKSTAEPMNTTHPLSNVMSWELWMLLDFQS